MSSLNWLAHVWAIKSLKTSRQKTVSGVQGSLNFPVYKFVDVEPYQPELLRLCFDPKKTKNKHKIITL